MELRHLRYFLAIASCQSFSRAAEALHVSQPSLSVQIAALEQELGTRLFDRLGRTVVLTQPGELLRQHAHRILREVELATQAVLELNGAQQGRLVVGVLSSANSYLIPPLVSRFKQQCPNIHLQVHARPSTEIVRALVANQLDIGICLLPVDDGRLTTVPLLDERLTLVAPASYRLRKPRLRMRELGSHPLVLTPADYCLRQMVESECLKARVKPHVVMEMSSPEGILQVVSNGAGLTILPEPFVRSYLPNASLRVIALYDPIPTHSVGLAYVTQRYQTLAAKEFVPLCQTTSAEIQGGSPRRPVGETRLGRPISVDKTVGLPQGSKARAVAATGDALQVAPVVR
jgi:DNA-binding transcriptional LysR family regulator